MNNETQNPTIESPEQSQLFEVEQAFHKELQNDLQEEYQKYKNETGDPDKIKLILQIIRGQKEHVYSKIAMIKRERIERQGYDTHAGIAASEHKKKEEAKKKAELEAQQQSENSQQDVNSENSQQDVNSDGEQTNENQPALEHVHPVVHEYEENLPAHDEPKKIIKNIKVVAPTPVIRYNPDGFRPYATMCDLFKSHAPIKIAGGTYDAGKTYSCVAYIDMLARQYPGARLTFIHRTLNRIYRNIIPTYEKYLGFRPTARTVPNPTPIVKHGGEQPIFFEYWNGSRIYMNGLDNPNNLLSDFFDAAFVNQAELIPFDKWLEVTARVSERAGTMPIAFLIADCNPSTPDHWIRHQTKNGKVQYFELSFRDNPEIYNQETGELTEIGERRVDRLKNLEGLRFKRGYEGKWESAEGLVFDKFSPEIHIIDNFEIDPNWKRYLSVDWGFRNPSSCIWWAESPDDRLYAYKEIYKTGLTRTDLIDMIEANCGDDDYIRYAAVDSADQDGVEHIRRARLPVKEPKNRVLHRLTRSNNV